MFDRLKTLGHHLTDNTVLADLLATVSRALARVRHAAVGRTLTMADFITLGGPANAGDVDPARAGANHALSGTASLRPRPG